MSGTLNIPRRKRMRQPQRLVMGKESFKNNPGKRIVSRYAKWFAVDMLGAVKELRLLGTDITPEYEEQIKRDIANKAAKKRKNWKCGRMQSVLIHLTALICQRKNALLENLSSNRSFKLFQNS
jgi:hypothetical protein